ncbi:MAG: hypothetical protein J1E00_01205 [Oscillospiraceae bacterium]|nr:hypothetical protein [Oscillospiraceae bacterium]
MKRTKSISRVIACLFALLLAFATVLLCACGEEGTGGSNSSAGNGSPDAETSAQESSDADSETSGPSDAESSDLPPAVVDLTGRKINILCKDFTTSAIQGYTGEVLYSQEGNASSVDVAKKAIIDYVESLYGCTVDGVLDNSNDLVQLVQNMVISDTHDYDMIFTNLASLVSMSQAGTLMDLNSIHTLNLNNSWWDQNAVSQLSIAHKLFYVNGDINTFDDLGTFCVIFNKSLKNRLSIEEDFYQTVRDGNWTLDHFMEVCKGITVDLDGDGINERDQWALGTETYNIFVQVLGGGLHLIEKDENDLPYIAFKNNPQRHYSALDAITAFYRSADVMVADDGSHSHLQNEFEDTVNKAFREGRELFYMGGLFNLAAFRDMEDDIGVLPIPKTFQNQDNYYHTVSTYGTTFLAIPYGVQGAEELGLVIEALAMKSQELLTPVFYDTQLKYRDLRDNESGEMLDLIFATRLFDHGPAYNWGGMLGIFRSLDMDYASRFESSMDSIQSALDDTIQLIQEQNS